MRQRFIDSPETKTVNDSRIVLKDRKGSGATYILNNPNQIDVSYVQSDGKLYEADKGPERCDFCIFSNEANTAILLELKGRDLRKAISQLQSSFTDFRSKYSYSRYYARAVLSKVSKPRLLDNEMKYFRKQLRAVNGTFEYKSQLLEERLHKDFSL